MWQVILCLRGWRMTFESYTSNFCCVIPWSCRLWFGMKWWRIILTTSCHDCSYSHFQFSHPVMSESFWPHEPQQARPPCLPSPSHPALNLSQHHSLFQWVSSLHYGAKVEVSASKSFLPMNTQDGYPLEWTGWISVQSKGLSRVFSNTTVQKHQFFSVQLSL